MSAAQWDATDPILDAAELTHDCEELPYICDWCEEPCRELTTVDDSDRGVGYRDDLQVCENCIAQYKKESR